MPVNFAPPTKFIAVQDPSGGPAIQVPVTFDNNGLLIVNHAYAPAAAGLSMSGVNVNSNPSEQLLASVVADMNTATAQGLFTVPSNKSCVITRVGLRGASISLTLASISFGFTSAAFNDVIANATHTELTGPTLYTVLAAKTGAKIGVAGAVFTVLDNTLQGAAATVVIDVFGYLV